MKILSKSIVNILSRSKFASNSTNSFRKIQTHIPALVKQHNKLNLLLVHQHNCIWGISSFRTEDSDNNKPYATFSGHVVGHYRCFDPVASCKLLLFGYMDDQQRALWNPATDEVKTLPKSSVPRPPSVMREHFYVYGFGFDPASQDYKVIRFLEFDYEDGTESELSPDQVELYSLKTDSWKEIAYSHNDIAIPTICSYPIHINGFGYWEALFYQEHVILTFDFANESFSSVYIPMPETDKLRGRWSGILLAEFEGSLAVVVYADVDLLETDSKPFEYEIWVWSNDEGLWTRLSTIDVPAPIGKLVGLFKVGHLYYIDVMGEVMLLDCVKGNLKNLGLKADQKATIHMFPYVESLKPIGASQTGDVV